MPSPIASATTRRPRVLVVQRIVPHYRVPFLLRLAERLAGMGIDLHVAHGPERVGEAPASVGAAGLPVAWTTWCPNTYRAGVVWQHLGGLWRDADLIIVEEAERLLLNHLLHLRRLLCRRPRLAFWGHGLDWQRPRDACINRVKRRLRGGVDHWFCYTEAVAAELSEVPAARKTVVDNCIDSAALAAAVQATAAGGTAKADDRLLFIGSMRRERRFDQLLPALDRVHAARPGLRVDFIGDGPEAEAVRDFCAMRAAWAAWLGPRFGAETAAPLWRATALAMPGPVGLAVIDGFVAETPVVTAAADGPRSPEEGYLRDGDNALLTSASVDAFAEGLTRVLADAPLRHRLRAGCRASAARYTIDNMVERFAAGVRLALEPT